MDDEGAPEGWLPPRPPAPGEERRAPAPAPSDAADPERREPIGPDPAHPVAPVFVRDDRRDRPVGDAASPAPSDPLAPLSIGLGVLGLLVLLLSLGSGFLLALPCSLVAWQLGARVRRRNATPAPPPGRRPPGRVGEVLGLVGVGLGLVAIVTWVSLAAAGITVTDVQDSLERRLEQQRQQLRDQRPSDSGPARSEPPSLG